MKTIPTLLLLAALPVTALHAQKPINVYEDSIQFRTGKYPGIVVVIPEAGYESVQANWKKLLESGTRSKAVPENNEWNIFGAYFKAVSPNPVNVYSKLVNQDTAVQLLVSCELSKDRYVDNANSPDEFAKAKTLLKQFGKDQYSETADNQLSVEQKKLKELEKELSSLEDDVSKLEKDIRSAKSTIESENTNLKVLNNELNLISSEIVEQRTQLAALEEGVTKNERTKYVQELEKKKKKMSNNIESAEKKISKANDTIKDSNSKIPDNNSLQDDAKEKIRSQEAVVKKYEDKLKTIKSY